MDHPKIDPEFQSLIPAIESGAWAGLEEDIKSSGCRDALIVWKEQGILLDGHNRIEICDRNGIPYRINEISLPDRSAAKEWILRNQLNRRNLDDLSRVKVALLLKEEIASRAHGRMLAGKVDPVQKSAQGKTRDELAKIAGVSHDTLAKGQRILSGGCPELISAVKNKTISLNAANELSFMPIDEQKELMKESPEVIKKRSIEERKRRLDARDRKRERQKKLKELAPLPKSPKKHAGMSEGFHHVKAQVQDLVRRYEQMEDELDSVMASIREFYGSEELKKEAEELGKETLKIVRMADRIRQKFISY